MDYLKFNCHELAALYTEMYEAYSKLETINGELSDIFRSLAPHLKSYEGIANTLSAMTKCEADVTSRILVAADSLDRIVDIYYSAENRVMRASENLPIKTPVVSNASKSNTMPTVASIINNGDLVLEDWLAELVYKYGKDENGGYAPNSYTQE